MRLSDTISETRRSWACHAMALSHGWSGSGIHDGFRLVKDVQDARSTSAFVTIHVRFESA